MRKRQLEFEGFKRVKDAFGGSLLKGNPKTKRPLDSKLPISITLRAVKGGMRLPRAFGTVNELVYGTAKRHGVRIYGYANVGNHIHILVKIPSLRAWAAFIRELTGRVAQFMKGVLGQLGKFWKFRPHTRIVRGWRKPYQDIKLYIHLNELEGEGHINRREMKTLKDLREFYADVS